MLQRGGFNVEPDSLAISAIGAREAGCFREVCMYAGFMQEPGRELPLGTITQQYKYIRSYVHVLVLMHGNIYVHTALHIQIAAIRYTIIHYIQDTLKREVPILHSTLQYIHTVAVTFQTMYVCPSTGYIHTVLIKGTLPEKRKPNKGTRACPRVHVRLTL